MLLLAAFFLFVHRLHTGSDLKVDQDSDHVCFSHEPIILPWKTWNINIVTSVLVSHQRRPGNGGRTPALPRYRLIGPSCSSSAGSVIRPADLSTVEFDLQKDCS